MRIQWLSWKTVTGRPLRSQTFIIKIAKKKWNLLIAMHRDTRALQPQKKPLMNRKINGFQLEACGFGRCQLTTGLNFLRINNTSNATYIGVYPRVE